MCQKVRTYLQPHEAVTVQHKAEGVVGQYARLTKRAARPVHSTTKIGLGGDRISDERFATSVPAVTLSRILATCTPVDSLHASMKDEGGGMCGCVLRKKVRDAREYCLFEWW